MLGVPHLVYVNQVHHYQQSPDLTQGCSSHSNSHLRKKTQKFILWHMRRLLSMLTMGGIPAVEVPFGIASTARMPLYYGRSQQLSS